MVVHLKKYPKILLMLTKFLYKILGVIKFLYKKWWQRTLRTTWGVALSTRTFPTTKKWRQRTFSAGPRETWRSVIQEVRRGARKLCVGGRSFGGRIASHVVPEGIELEALSLFSYPLHPPGNPARPRDQHLPAIVVPTLFCSGTRDSFASPEELRAAAKKVEKSKLHLLEAADHGFAVPKSSGRTREDIWREAVTVLSEWLDDI